MTIPYKIEKQGRELREILKAIRETLNKLISISFSPIGAVLRPGINWEKIASFGQVWCLNMMGSYIFKTRGASKSKRRI